MFDNFWTRKEPIHENRIKRRDFIQAGLDEIDEDIRVGRIRLRNIKPVKGKGWKYP